MDACALGRNSPELCAEAMGEREQVRPASGRLPHPAHQHVEPAELVALKAIAVAERKGHEKALSDRLDLHRLLRTFPELRAEDGLVPIRLSILGARGDALLAWQEVARDPLKATMTSSTPTTDALETLGPTQLPRSHVARMLLDLLQTADPMDRVCSRDPTHLEHIWWWAYDDRGGANRADSDRHTQVLELQVASEVGASRTLRCLARRREEARGAPQKGEDEALRSDVSQVSPR